ncbi:SAM-dependent methyltransferase [Pseudonocardia sp. TRM90224]|uniref:SAM-dependent methyltransferase n=1 Tax=Pseudonocardia sp. TRM90224 TaxID=2812678 RepID=UPI001E5B19E9|nr:SAM-dependent methyltransferase [Pseudonocardia sp. TRM90224]
MERPSWAPDGIDLDRPSSARVYDYFLGGAHNFAIDRQLAEAISSMTPNVGDTMRANRSFLRRAVQFLVSEGVTQFLDVGSGIPTVGNVHEVAQEADPSSRVVYVDVDPIAVSHSKAILDGDARTAVVHADARDVDEILADTAVRDLLDFESPIAVLLLGVLHFVPDSDDPAGIVAKLRDGVPAGSYIALVNVTHEDQPPEVIEAQKLSGRTGTPIHLRSREELLAQFAGTELVEPGLVHIPLWRPDSPLDVDDRPERFGALAGIGRV